MTAQTQTISTYRIESGYRTENLTVYPNAKFFVKVYKGAKNVKLIRNLVFRTEEAMNTFTQKFINNIQLDLDRKQAVRNANKIVTADQFYKVGDIVVESGGYNQTNVYFYKVISIKNKKITIQEIAQHEVENSAYSHGMACEVMPSSDVVLNGDTYTLTVKAEGRLSQPGSFYFQKWDGRKMYKSWYN